MSMCEKAEVPILIWDKIDFFKRGITKKKGTLCNDNKINI